MRKFVFFFLFIIFTTGISLAQNVTIYRNEACGHCSMYLMDLKMFLDEKGVNITEKYMINNLSIREELNQFNSKYGVPIELQGHMVTIVGDLVLEGHVPLSILKPYFDTYPDYNFPKVIIYQDSMSEDIESYKVYYNSSISECSIRTQVQACLEGKSLSQIPQEAVLPIVISTALVDSINPCAFGVILFFIALMFTLKKSRGQMMKIGIVYTIMIFLTYLLIGIGILQAIIISESPHFIAQISAYAIIVLGFVNIKDYFWYGRWFSLRMPASQSKRIKHWMGKATLPSAIVLGFLVGLCEFPCSGGIYVGILGLLSVSTTWATGMLYLIIYNIIFVLPLVVILLMATNKRMVKKIDKWEKGEKKYMKLLNGVVMVLLGIFMLLLVVH